MLDYIVTSNHIHLLVKDTGANIIAEGMQLIRIPKPVPKRPAVQPLRSVQDVSDYDCQYADLQIFKLLTADGRARFGERLSDPR